MALMSWLRRLGERESRPAPAERVLTHRESSPAEHELRDELAQDPNDEAAFDALVEIVRERADEGTHVDPLTAAPDTRVAQDHAVWALAEELAGKPSAWLPLIVLARLSLAADHEAAMRRLNLACERETSGLALTHAVAMLRDADAPTEAIAFGVAHWELASRDAEAAGEIIQAALETGRTEEARRLLDSLETAPPSLTATVESAEAQNA
ncbi:hypothetical protein [Serinibacter arcticus]|uniref:hypothetical protein n=1 Tax=Serinibacter arcticus TaxID=1655435 RepID=UPI0010928CD1|nr:hypothetical protein [Serinibacter arcticus]